MQERWTPSLGQEDPLEEGMATCSRILAWRIPMDRGAWQATVHGVAKSQTQLRQPSMQACIHIRLLNKIKNNFFVYLVTKCLLNAY